ncbi:MAG: anthranilate synthase component I family protein [Bacteroidota bacterium]
MARTKRFFKVNDVKQFFQKANYWADQFSHFCSFNPLYENYPFGTFPRVIGAGAEFTLEGSNGSHFNALDRYIKQNKNWFFGHFGYDLKNEIEDLTSQNAERIQFPVLSFFRPIHLIHFQDNGIFIETKADPEDVFNRILKVQKPSYTEPDTDLKPDCTKPEYINTVKTLRSHIEKGDIYEINYCMNFSGDIIDPDPVELFTKLTHLSPNPFSVLYKINNKYTISASPERFIKKVGSEIISQPIKGTAARGSSMALDRKAKDNLEQSEKERAENMMIVDLVRNDLAKSCIPGSVKVNEMFGIYTFSQLHQMISTVSGQLNQVSSTVDSIKNAFPMGSMTGAPKIKVMELIEKYENSKRGLFSGSIGYFSPNNDYDFNVVIRSLFYDSNTNQLSFSVGSAITYDSDPEKEYEECLLKASAIMALIQGKNNN